MTFLTSSPQVTLRLCTLSTGVVPRIAPSHKAGEPGLMPSGKRTGSEGDELLAAQHGAVARRQAGARGQAVRGQGAPGQGAPGQATAGPDAATMRNRTRSGRWQRPYRGVYYAFTGTPEREALLWAALLRAGPGAVLSHQTAAERHGLIDEPSELIHITVPAARHPARRRKISGVVIHRSVSIERARHPAMSLPCRAPLRFGLPDLDARRCQTARDVATRLRRSGWRGRFRPCARCASEPVP
jgi:hypothetical protein